MQDLPIDASFFKVANIVLIIAVTYILSTIIRIVLDKLAERFPARRLFFKRLQPMAQFGSYAIGVYFVIQVVSPDKDSLMAMLLSMGFAIGLAAQDLLKDLIGGIVVLVDTSFQVGDRIRVEEIYGEVTKIGLRSTKIATLDNEMVTIPNSKLLQADIINASDGLVESSVTTHLYVPSHADLDNIETIVREAVLTSKLTYIKEPVTIAIEDTVQDGEAVTHLTIRAYAYDARYEEMFVSDITRRVKKVVYERGLFDMDEDSTAPYDKRIDSALADTLIAMGARFAYQRPALSQQNGR